MTTMIERVARAIYEDRNGRGCAPWGRLTKAHQEPYLSDARAGIEAMREPSAKMLDEGFRALISGDDDALDTSTSDAIKCWRAMIAAALKEK